MVSWSYGMLFSVLTRLVARWWAAPASHTEWRIYRTAGDSHGAPGKAWSGFHSDEAELSPPAAAKRWIVRKKNKQMTPPPSPNKNSKKIHVCSYLVMQGPSEFLYVDWMFIQHKFNDLVQERHVWNVSCHPLSQPVKFLDTRDRAGYVFPRVGLRRQREFTLVTLQNTYIRS